MQARRRDEPVSPNVPLFGPINSNHPVLSINKDRLPALSQRLAVFTPSDIPTHPREHYRGFTTIDHSIYYVMISCSRAPPALLISPWFAVLLHATVGLTFLSRIVLLHVPPWPSYRSPLNWLLFMQGWASCLGTLHWFTGRVDAARGGLQLQPTDINKGRIKSSRYHNVTNAAARPYISPTVEHYTQALSCNLH